MNLKDLLIERHLLEKERADVLATVQPALDAIDNDINKITATIETLVADPVKLMRDAEGKPYGMITVECFQGVKIKHDQPKRVKWNEALLAGIVEKIKASSADPAEYVKISYKVEERKYNAWPKQIKDIFEPARTTELAPVKMSFEILDADEDPVELPANVIPMTGRA